jgi:hypothetical protein
VQLLTASRLTTTTPGDDLQARPRIRFICGGIRRQDPRRRSTEESADGEADSSSDLRQFVATLQEENRRLWRERDTRTEELYRKDAITMALAARPQQSPAPPDTPDVVRQPSSPHSWWAFRRR